MSAGGAVRRPTEMSRIRILAAAAEVAAEAGYEGTTISKITGRSGLPVSSVYWFFKDKDQLLAEVVRHSYERWSARQPTWSQPPVGMPFIDALANNLRVSLRGIASTPDFLRIGHMLTLQARPTESAARTTFLAIRDGVERRITDWYTRNLPTDVTARAPEVAPDLARVTLAATEGLFLAEQIDDTWDADEFVTFIVAIVMAAVDANRD